MPNFDPSNVTNLVGLWDFRSGATTADTGLDDGIAQNGEFSGDANASGDVANFDGNGDDFDVDGAGFATTDAPFDMARGTIEVQFVQDAHVGSSPDTLVNRGEYADRVSEGYFNIAVQADGAIRVTHFANGQDVSFSTNAGLVSPGQNVNVTYTWDEATGVSLSVENLDSGSSQTITSATTGLTMAIGDDDDENFTFGARETDDGVKDQFFDGSIDYVAIYEDTAPEPDGAVDGEDSGELMELGYDDSNLPTDQGGDVITNDADLIYGNGGDDTISGAGGDDTIYGDNGPATAGTAVGPNLIVNGSFEDTTGMNAISYGFTDLGAIPGWTSYDDLGNPVNDKIDVHNDGRGSVVASDGNNWLDLEGDGNNVRIGQDIAGLEEGETYRLTFDINDFQNRNAESDDPNVENFVEVFWNGVQIAELDPSNAGSDTSWENLTFDLTAGPGDNRLEFRGTGQLDNIGASVDNVELFLVDSADDSLSGNDVLSGDDGMDVIYGQEGDDTITGGADNDLIYGDNGDTTGSGADAVTLADVDPVAINFANSSDETAAANDAGPGDSVVYNNVATLEDGTVVGARLVLVSSSDPSLQIDLATDADSEILLNANNDASMEGETATFRFEFFDQATGDPVELEPGIVFADLDQNVGQEVLRIDTDTLLNVGVPADSSLDVNFSDGVLVANGTEDNIDANDLDSQVATVFGTTSSVEFTLTARGVNSGTNFGTLDGQEFTYVVPFGSDSSANGNDVLTGDEGQDTIFGEGGDDTITGGAEADSLSGGDDADVFLGGTDGDVVDGGSGGDDFDTLDLRGLGQIDIVDEVTDADGNSTSGTINFLDTGGSMTFSEIEEILSDPPSGPPPVGPVDGLDDGELMEPLYTDAQGDQIDGADGNDDTIFGNGGNDTIDSGDGNDSVEGGDGDDTFVISESGDGIDNDIIIGGEGDEIDGDTLDISDVEDDLYVDIFAPETGTVTDGVTGDVTNFSEIENILLGAGDDTVMGSTGDDNVDSGGGNDSMFGGEGNDTLSSGDGLDTVDGGIGDDSLTGGDEADSILGGIGDDTLVGGRGPDTLDGGAGDDSMLGGADDDSIIGGDGSDVVEDLGGNNIIDTSGGDNLPDIGFPSYGPFPAVPADSDPDDDRDFVTTGSGNDSITTGDDADTIISGAGNDTIDAGIDDDYVEAGSGDDLVTTGEGNDTVLGGDGNDTIYGGLGPSFASVIDIPDAPGTGPFGPDPEPGNGRDFIDGGRGNDVIYGEDDDDTLIGGLGADTLDGGIDDDLLQGGVGQDDMIGGQGADTMEGGDDRDFFIINERTDAFGDVIDGGTGGNDVDRLTLTGLGRFEIVDETTDADGDSTSGTVNFLDDLGNIEGSLVFSEIENLVICFTPGTAIATPRGEIDVANLQVGDRVITRDNGVQEISWIGRKKLGAADLIADPKLRPVLIKKGSLGNNLPERDMMVSPNHRMLMANSQTQVLFDEREVLVASKYLVGQPGIFQLDSLGVEYVHVMFENHEVILGDGTWTESFQPGDHSLSGIDEEQREEIFKLFPSLQNEKGRRAYSSARQSLKAHEAKMLRDTMGLV